MTVGTLEHVNISVSDIERSTKLMHDLFGWSVRWSGEATGGKTVHIGTDTQYLALYQPDAFPPDAGASGGGRFGKGRPLNHVGVTVDDLDAVEAKVLAAGLKPFSHGDYEPGRRFYFFDWDGIEIEVVSYAQ